MTHLKDIFSSHIKVNMESQLTYTISSAQLWYEKFIWRYIYSLSNFYQWDPSTTILIEQMCEL